VTEVGQAAPDFAFARAGGGVVHLSHFWRERPTIVLFLRHFG
jgi:peroxiredoxin